MGVGFEFILDLVSVEAASSAERFSLDVYIIGRCEKGAGSNTGDPFEVRRLPPRIDESLARRLEWEDDLGSQHPCPYLCGSVDASEPARVFTK
jgi:hypothetical protein